MVYSKAKGTRDHNFNKIAWVEIDGRECYAVRKFFTPKDEYGRRIVDYISIPRRYYDPSNSSCRLKGTNDTFLITISQERQTGEFKGNLFYPHVYELQGFTLLDIEEKDDIQKEHTHGKNVPISDLFIYKERTQEEAKRENKEAYKRAELKKKKLNLV